MTTSARGSKSRASASSKTNRLQLSFSDKVPATREERRTYVACKHQGRHAWKLREMQHMRLSGLVQSSSMTPYIWEAWLLFRPAEDIHVASFVLNGDRCYEPVGLFLPDGTLRPQLHTSVFGPEVNEGHLLMIKQVKPLCEGSTNTSTAQLVAATHCVIATLAATFQPGFLVVMPEAWDWDVAQIPGCHCMLQIDVLACVPCKPDHPCFRIPPSVTRESYAITLQDDCMPTDKELPYMDKRLLRSMFFNAHVTWDQDQAMSYGEDPQRVVNLHLTAEVDQLLLRAEGKRVPRKAGSQRPDLGTLAGVVRWVKRGGSLDCVGALHDAVDKQQAWLIKALLRLGADINHQQLAGHTAMHAAVMATASDPACMKELLASGPDLTIKSVMGLTAYDILCQDLSVRADMCTAFKTFAGGAIFDDCSTYPSTMLQCVKMLSKASHAQGVTSLWDKPCWHTLEGLEAAFADSLSGNALRTPGA